MKTLAVLALLFSSVFIFSPSFAMNKNAGSMPSAEVRGVWVDKGDLYKGREWMVSMLDKLSSAGFNTVCLPLFYKGYVSYPGSKYVPQDPKLTADPDIIPFLIQEIHKRGMTAQAWTEYGFGTHHTKDITEKTHGAILDAHPELTAIDANGLPYEQIKEWGYFYGMCPSNPKSHEILGNIFLEAMSKMPFDALNLDRMRYANTKFCFCPYCREHFAKDTGYALPEKGLPDGTVLKAFMDWRKTQVSKFVAALAPQVRKMRPNVKITAAVWYAGELDNMGQDWPLWLSNGFIDLAMPMIYWPGNDGVVQATLNLSGDPSKVAVGISSEDCNAKEVARQITFARNAGAGGVMIWFLSPLEGQIAELSSTVFAPKEAVKPGQDSKARAAKAIKALKPAAR